MRRGFKAESERIAASVRVELGLTEIDVLDPWRMAAHRGVLVRGADELNLAAEHAAQLMVNDRDAWSGMTLSERDTKLIVLNPMHSAARQCATLMHELAHILLDHAPASAVASVSGLVLLSDYSDDQESEADWLGAALLLPEAALLHHRAAGKSPAQIAQMFGVSLDLCNWRCRMTGVEKRLSYRRSA